MAFYRRRLKRKTLSIMNIKKCSAFRYHAKGENLLETSDVKGYNEDFLNLFGFGFKDVDYNADINPEIPMPSIKQA